MYLAAVGANVNQITVHYRCRIYHSRGKRVIPLLTLGRCVYCHHSAISGTRINDAILHCGPRPSALWLRRADARDQHQGQESDYCNEKELWLFHSIAKVRDRSHPPRRDYSELFSWPLASYLGPIHIS